MTEQSVRFVDWLAQRLAGQGVRHAFGVPGGGTTLDLLVALKSAGVETVITAREDAATIMAGVSGVLSEGPGLAFCTKGPGLASAANGLASASLDRMPALLMAETFIPGELDYVSHQAFDQPGFTAPLLPGGASGVLDPVPEAVDAWLGRGPRPIREPAVMFATGEDFRRFVEPSPAVAPKLPPVADEDLEAARHLLAGSRHPIVVVGLEAARSDVATPLRAFVEALGAPALCTYMAAGALPTDHPNYAGIFTGGAIEQACVQEADLIVLVGLDPVELIRKPWTYAAPVLDLVEVARSPHYLVPQHRVLGSLEATLAALIDGTTAGGWSVSTIAGHRRRFFDGMTVQAESGLSSGDVVKRADRAFADRAARPRLSVDAGAHMFSACAFWASTKPRDLLISNGLASMGFAVPAALAAALHDPARGAVAMTGDGGLLMCLGELKTAVETRARLCVIVFNDGRLSLIDIKREERQMAELGMTWQRPDFATMARGFGMMAWRVEDASGLTEALDQAAATDGPTLIDVVVDPGGYLAQMKALRG
ncbi:MAG: thiamine pyrophosphate-binding protein [Alphaproteobacteria bacterium]|nr:thiamine pyrophosphate-binding protein [Alphaproteobacteria bacterium]